MRRLKKFFALAHPLCCILQQSADSDRGTMLRMRDENNFSRWFVTPMAEVFTPKSVRHEQSAKYRG
jgi:hypothetical protein